MWYLPQDESSVKVKAAPDSKHPNPKPATGANPIVLKQCWFPGVHTDVGGGYDHEKFAEFSDMTFAWMIDQCEGLLAFEDKYIKDQTQQRPLIRQQNLIEKLIKKDPGEGVGWAMGYIHDSFEHIFMLGSSKYRTPGQYNPSGSGDLVAGNMESIHPSVRVRMMKMPSWKFPALEGFEAVRHDGEWKWVKNIKGSEKPVIIPEYPIKKGSWEDNMLTKEDRDDFLNKVDWKFPSLVGTGFWGRIWAWFGR